MKLNQRQRVYKRSACAVFYKTKKKFGGLSNMAGGFPIDINGVIVGSSEALFQAFKFPNHPGIQCKILNTSNPLISKWTAKGNKKHRRKDWDKINDKIMAWCLRVKLACNYESFGNLLEAISKIVLVLFTKSMYVSTWQNEKNYQTHSGQLSGPCYQKQSCETMAEVVLDNQIAKS